MSSNSAPITAARRHLRRRGSWLVALVALMWVLGPTPASAVEVITSGGLYTDGLGGFGIDGSTNHGIWIGDGAGTAIVKVMPDCQDSAGNHLNYTQSSQTFTCGVTTSGGTTPAKPMGFTTVSVVDLSTNSVFISPTGNISATEANVARMPVPITGTLDNLRCSSSADPAGTSLKVQMQVVTCGSPGTFTCAAGDQCVTLPASALTTAADTDDLAVTAGQCLVFKATAVGDTVAVWLGCSWTLT